MRLRASIAFLAFGLFLVPFFSYAAGYQLDDTAQTATGDEWTQYLSVASSTDFRAIFDTLNLTLSVHNTSTLTAQVAPLTSCSSTAGLDTATQNVVMTNQTAIEIDTKKLYTFTISTPTSTIDGKCYALRIQQSSGTKPNVWGSSDPDSYPYGVLLNAPAGSEDTNVKDAYFSFFSARDIEIIDPSYGEVRYTDFGTAKIYYRISASSTYSNAGTLTYGYTSSSLDNVDFFALDTTEGTHITDVGLSTPLSQGVLWLQAKIFDASSTLLATSSLIYVNLLNAPATIENLASSTINVSAYCQNLSGIQLSLCNSIANGISRLARKPPFGYVILFKEGILNLSTSTASSTYSIPDYSNSFGGIFLTIRTAITTIFWVLFMVWLIIKFGKVRF